MLGSSQPYTVLSQWSHQMETISLLLALCVGNTSVTGEFPSQKTMTRSFDVFFLSGLNNQSSKQWRHRWFETPWRSLWCHCNDVLYYTHRAVFQEMGPSTNMRCSVWYNVWCMTRYDIIWIYRYIITRSWLPCFVKRYINSKPDPKLCIVLLILYWSLAPKNSGFWIEGDIHILIRTHWNNHHNHHQCL